MGKWTSEYYDDVLGAKIKSLVSGAVTRSKLEKCEPSISYEAFVEDLDPGDSFTTMLTELLVREMAERRHRQVAADRRLISDRTAKGLRTLAAPQRVYRDRGMRGLASRRSLNLTDYLVVPPEEMELDDDNDSLESAVEGARINYDLYDAYTNRTGLSTEPHLSPPPPHLRHVLRSTRRESWGTLRDASPDAWGPPPPPSAAPSAPPLTRQPSIRRVPARSRTVDFTDFTSRRRSTGREGNSSSVTAGDTEIDDSATHTSASPFPPLSAMGMPPRRFFPSRRPELPWSPHPDSTSTSTDSSPNLATGANTSATTGAGAGAMPSTRSSPAPVPVPVPTSLAFSRQQMDAPRDQRTFLSWLPSSALLSLPPPPPTDARSNPRAGPRLRMRPPESLLPVPRPHVAMLRTESPEPLGLEGAAPMAVSAPSPAQGE